MLIIEVYYRSQRVKGPRYREDAIGMRIALIDYVNSEEASVSWQKNCVSRTSY